MIDLSVVIVTWNTRDLTLRCLESVAYALASWSERSGRCGEIVLVDNGSEDGTLAAVERSGAPVRAQRLESNRGFAGGANVGLAGSRGRIVLLLNSDATIDVDAIAICFAVFEAEPTVGVVGPQLLHPDGRLQNSVHAFPSLASELLPTWLLELGWPRRFPSKRRGNDRPRDVDALRGAAFFVRREVIEAVGGLDEGYFFFLEETDWCWRIRAAGWRIRHLPDARVVHVSGASSKRRDPARTRIEYHRSLYRFVRAHRGVASARAVRAVRIGKGLASVILLAVVAPLAGAQRTRLRERARVLAWHLRGCPAEAGLCGPGGAPRA